MVVDEAGEIFGGAPNVAARDPALAEPGDGHGHGSRAKSGVRPVRRRGSRRAYPQRRVRAGRRSFGSCARAAGGAPARALTPLVGREKELALLRRQWDRAGDGAGQFTLIVGEAGIGKSRLLEEFRATLGQTPHTWSELSSQLLQNTPLHPVAESGRQRFGVDEPAEPAPRRPREHARLIGLDPGEYAPLLAPLVDIPLPEERATKLAPEELRRRQLAALVAWLLAGARSQPIALAFEDLHWADPTSLDLLRDPGRRGRTGAAASSSRPRGRNSGRPGARARTTASSRSSPSIAPTWRGWSANWPLVRR